MNPPHANFSCPHKGLAGAVEVEHYKVSICTTAGSGTGRYYYQVIDEFYSPDHDCSYNVVDASYSLTEKEFNVFSGKRKECNDSFMQPTKHKEEEEAFGRKKLSVDNRVIERICTLARAQKFVNQEKKSLGQIISDSHK
jgi:hypothetical protein